MILRPTRGGGGSKERVAASLSPEPTGADGGRSGSWQGAAFRQGLSSRATPAAADAGAWPFALGGASGFGDPQQHEDPRHFGPHWQTSEWASRSNDPASDTLDAAASPPQTQASASKAAGQGRRRAWSQGVWGRCDRTATVGTLADERAGGRDHVPGRPDRCQGATRGGNPRERRVVDPPPWAKITGSVAESRWRRSRNLAGGARATGFAFFPERSPGRAREGDGRWVRVSPPGRADRPRRSISAVQFAGPICSNPKSHRPRGHENRRETGCELDGLASPWPPG